MLNLNINKDDQNLNNYLYCWDQFKSKPNKTVIHSTYSTKLFQDKIEKYNGYWKNTFTEIIPDEDDSIINENILLKITEDIFISYFIIDKLLDTSIVSELTIYYKYDVKSEKVNDIIIDKVNDIISDFNDCLVDFIDDELESSKLNTISIGQNGLDIEPITHIDLDTDNIELYYNNKTFKEVNKAIKKIKKSDRGLLILNGERGTGKTSIVKHISDLLDRIVIFIPNNLIDQTINNPDFRKFIKRYTKPVLVLDDCEMIFNEYFNKSNMITNNLLQITDGLMYNDVTIITIFNTEDRLEMDHTLMESNNLIDIIDFNYLEKDEANELSSIIKSSKKYKLETKLIDVIKKKTVDSKKQIGF
jgi:hypothetical protein